MNTLALTAGRLRADVADRRFILPTRSTLRFSCLVLLCAEDRVNDHVRELPIAVEVIERVPNEKQADAVVALMGSRLPLADVARCLAPGGVLYYDIGGSQTRGLTLSRLRRRLALSGLLFRTAHWVRPGFSNRRVYIPLEPRTALAWYLLNLWTSHSAAGRLSRPDTVPYVRWHAVLAGLSAGIFSTNPFGRIGHEGSAA